MEYTKTFEMLRCAIDYAYLLKFYPYTIKIIRRHPDRKGFYQVLFTDRKN